MVDRYTRAVLTVIAVALSVIAVQNFAGRAAAQGADIQKVQICDEQHCAQVAPVTEVLFGKGYTYWAVRTVAPAKP